MLCPYCGNPLPKAGAFCPCCGKKDTPPEPKQETPPAPKQVKQPAPKPQNTPAPKAPVPWKTILAAALGGAVVMFILILAVLVGGLFFGTEKNDGQDVTVQQAPEAEATVDVAPTEATEAPTTEPATTEPPRPTLSASNPYYDYFPGADGYAMAGSDSRYLTASDLAHLEHHHLVIIRNEIFARRGYTFSSSELSEFFGCTDWYTPDPGFSSSMFNKYENANIVLCDLYEKKLEGVKFSSDNPYKAYFAGKNSYVMPHSNTDYLHEGDLYELPKAKAALARNEILARHGYTFESKHLQEYFLQCSWYKPTTPPGSTSGMKLSKLENTNIEYLKAYENSLASQPNLDKLDTTLSYTVDAGGYTITLPAYWKTYAVRDGMSFSEKENTKKDGYGGLLFELDLYTSLEELGDLPFHDLWGVLNDDKGHMWYLVAYFPSDVQFKPGTEALYHKMYSEIERIEKTVKANPGYEYTPN